MLDEIQSVLSGRTPIMSCVAGSALYGVKTPGSDDDLRGVFAPSPREILTGKTTFGIKSNTASRRLGAGDVDTAMVSAQRYVALLGKLDMVSVEILYASRSPELSMSLDRDLWAPIFANRDSLLAGSTASAIGHARERVTGIWPDADKHATEAQIVLDLIESLRRAGDERISDSPQLMAALAERPEVALVIVPQDSSEAKIPWEEMTEEEREIGVSARGVVHMRACSRMFATRNRIDQISTVLRNIINRDAHRRRQENHGRDIVWKDAYHAVRILHQAVELHETRELVFPRPEAALLMRIRQGLTAVEEIVALTTDLLDKIRVAEARYPFPAAADCDVVDGVICEIHRAVLRRG